MQTFNRFLVILVCLSGVVFWCLVLLVLWFAPTELGSLLGQVGRQLRLEPVVVQVLASGFGASSILVALLILAGEFSAQTAGTVLLIQGGKKAARVSLDAIAAHLRSALEGSEGVAHVRPMVRRASTTAVEVRLEVEAAPGAMLPPLADALAKAVRGEVETGLGVGLRGVSVHFVDAANFRANSGGRLPTIGDQPVVVPSAPLAPTAPTDVP